MHFLPQKAIKGQAIIDFMVENPAFGPEKIYEDITNEIAEVHMVQTSLEDQVWKMFFDGASRVNPSRVLVAGVIPRNKHPDQIFFIIIYVYFYAYILVRIHLRMIRPLCTYF